MKDTTPTLTTLQNRLKAILPEITDRYHIHTLSIFGSYVRGEQNEESDLDLLVTFTIVPSLLTLIELENTLTDLLGIPVDLVMADSLKPAVGYQARKEAIAV